MAPSSRTLARTWPYPRHRHFISELRSVAANWFETKGYEVSEDYDFILADWSDWPRNIILPEVAEYIQHVAEVQRRDGASFPLHNQLHHGLSSQAMLFNLVGPLLVRDDLSPLRLVLEKKGVSWPGEGSTARFEYEDRAVFNEDSGQPTSIDLVIFDDENAPRIFIESKFVEPEFGGCSVFGSGDCDGRNPSSNLDLCYLHHIGRRYWSLMKHYGIDQGQIGEDSACVLANHYQFFREVLFSMEHDGIFVLLCDERSPVFYTDGAQGPRGVMPFLLNMVPGGARNRVSHVTVQELVAAIEGTANPSWVQEFKRKYGIV